MLEFRVFAECRSGSLTAQAGTLARHLAAPGAPVTLCCEPLVGFVPLEKLRATGVEVALDWCCICWATAYT